VKSAEFFQRDRLWQPPALSPDYKTLVARSPRLPLLSLEQSLSEITGQPSAMATSTRSTTT
jgi:protocatechuate 3,4-dioxygenase beta subunit